MRVWAQINTGSEPLRQAAPWPVESKSEVARSRRAGNGGVRPCQRSGYQELTLFSRIEPRKDRVRKRIALGLLG